MIKYKSTGALQLFVGLALLLTPTMADEENSNWKDTLKNMGKVYSDNDNPTIQEIELFGRAQYQWNYSDGESAEFDFSGDGDELRRVRSGASVKFLGNFETLARANFVKGGFRKTSIGFDSFDELFVEYSEDGLFGFYSATIGYGRYKASLGAEEHRSSKRLKTMERSNINNRFGSLRPTGIVLKAEKNDIEYLAGIYSTDSDPESWSQWNGGVAFQGSTTFSAYDGEVILDFMYADDPSNDRSLFDFDWATSASYSRQYGDWNLLTSATFGTDGNNDIFGIVILPTYLISERLEAVFRYQWANSSAMTGVPKSSSSRGLRRVARSDGVGTGSGDDNHTLYAGLNYYIAGDNMMIMTGIEYESIDGARGLGIEGITFWTAFRTYF